MTRFKRIKDAASMAVLPDQAIGLCDSFLEDLRFHGSIPQEVVCIACKKNTKYRYFGMCRKCAD